MTERDYYVQYGIEDDYYEAIAEFGEESDEAANWADCSDLVTWGEAQAIAVQCLVEWCESTIEAQIEVARDSGIHHNEEQEAIVAENCERYLAQIREVIQSKPSEHGQTSFSGPVPGELIHINAT